MSALCICLGLISSAFAYENIALHKPTYQQYPYSGPGLEKHLVRSSNAVDGLKVTLSVWGGQCVISDNEKYNATWWVNLTSILSIHHIIIYYRTDNKEWGPSNGLTPRFLGFSVYVSNTTDKRDGSLCFKDNNFTVYTIPAIFNTTCPIHGQYVIYYNERSYNTTNYDPNYQYAYNELCEFEVFGCPVPGFYGSSCSIPCLDRNCRYCHIETGTCLGCKPGYQGHRCDGACPRGFFGQGCVNKCISTCRGCNNSNGLCDTGCYPGWEGNSCHESCRAGFYGEKCSMKCGYCLNEETCYHVNGSCLVGCEAGYQAPLCTKECDNSYGPGCTEACGHCIDSQPCNHINGSCTNGCAPGFKGEKCIEECEVGYYGVGCVQECSTFCKTSRNCHHVSGSCKDGCKNGWQGHDCFEVSKAANTCTCNQSSFFSILGLFCVSLLLNGVFIAYIIILRKSRTKGLNAYQPDKSTDTKIEQYGKNSSGDVSSGYQEMGEFGQNGSTYDTIQ